MAITVASVSVVVAMGGTKHFRAHQPPPSMAPDLTTTSNSRPTAPFSSSRPDIVFVVNPRGANGRTGKEWKKLLPSLKSRLGHQYNVHENFTSGPGHAMDITREAIREGVNAVIAVGGDGTFHEVVNGFFWDGKPVSCEDASASGATALGLIPLGTGSDFARTYGWRNDPHEGIERIAKGLRSWINVGVISGENRKEHYFINVADLHLSAKAGYYASRYKRFGNLCYVIGALQGFMGHRNQDLRIKIDDGKWEVFSNVTALCIGNAKYFGGGMKITPNADPSSESFEMVVLQDFEWYDFILNLQKLYNGTHLSVNNVTSIRAAVPAKMASLLPKASPISHLTSSPRPLFADSRVDPKNTSFKCFGQNPTSSRSSSSQSSSMKLQEKESEPQNALLKLAWYGSELLGIAASFLRPQTPTDSEEYGGTRSSSVLSVDGSGALDRDAVVAAVKEDFQRSYFVTGNLTLDAYEEKCEFADPAGSFKGLQRFQRNCTNFGSLINKCNMKLMKWEDFEDKAVGHWRFSCILTFPWRPILSATGYTEYFFDEESGKVCRHVEHWNVPKMTLLKQILKPSRGLPR